MYIYVSSIHKYCSSNSYTTYIGCFKKRCTCIQYIGYVTHTVCTNVHTSGVYKGILHVHVYTSGSQGCYVDNKTANRVDNTSGVLKDLRLEKTSGAMYDTTLCTTYIIVIIHLLFYTELNYKLQ